MTATREDALYVIRQGRSASRQLRLQAGAGVMTKEDALRLLGKVDAAFDQILGNEGVGDAARRNLADLVVVEGGRR